MRGSIAALLAAQCMFAARIAFSDDAAVVTSGDRDRQFAALAASTEDYLIRGEQLEALPIELAPEALLRWSNPQRGTPDGGLFLWTQNGRPAVVTCAFWRSESQYKHELHSLLDSGLTAVVGGEIVWAPEAPGVEWKPLTEPGDVASTRTLRLVQMRRIAAAFEATIVTGEKSGASQPLRLQTQPLYRYPESVPADQAVDGALFSFVQATDPEVLLLIEARESVERGRTWHAAVARMSKFAQVVTYNQAEVWNCAWSGGGKRSQAYFVRTVNVEPRAAD